MKRGIPKEILDQLDIKVQEPKEQEITTTAIVESHQIKLPIPAQLRKELEISKGQKFSVEYNPTTKTITYKLK